MRLLSLTLLLSVAVALPSAEKSCSGVSPHILPLLFPMVILNLNSFSPPANELGVMPIR
jgi:hypothetical protein